MPSQTRWLLVAALIAAGNQTSHVGQLLGPAALGTFVQHAGWSLAPLLFAVIAVVGIAIGLALRQLLQASGAATEPCAEG